MKNIHFIFNFGYVFIKNIHVEMWEVEDNGILARWNAMTKF